MNKIAIVGAGPSALYIMRKFLDNKATDFTIDIFEKNSQLGPGMPYSKTGARDEHITNISSHEVPQLCDTLEDWLVRQPTKILQGFNVDKNQFHSKQVVPRLLFGLYLRDQFTLVIERCRQQGLEVIVHENFDVVDIEPNKHNTYTICSTSNKVDGFDSVIISIGHHWPTTNETLYSGFYDSPYPPEKLNKIFNHPIAVKGGSLTAIDAINTLSHANGEFARVEGQLRYVAADNAKNFKIIIHCIDGLLPCVRSNIPDHSVSICHTLSPDEIDHHRSLHNGFVSLDYLFQAHFKEPLKEIDNEFYQSIVMHDLDSFVTSVMDSRRAFEPITLLKTDYLQAEQSIQAGHTIHWKRLFGMLSFVSNQYARYFSAEDTLRFTRIVKPLVGIIIAEMPQTSAELLISLHAADVLSIVAVTAESKIQIEGQNKFHYVLGNQTVADHQAFETFIDCTGQSAFAIEDFPFKSLLNKENAVQAQVHFANSREAELEGTKSPQTVDSVCDSKGTLLLNGFAISENFQPIMANGHTLQNCYLMSAPYITGFVPDYSGLDVSEQLASIIVDRICLV